MGKLYTGRRRCKSSHGICTAAAHCPTTPLTRLPACTVAQSEIHVWVCDAALRNISTAMAVEAGHRWHDASLQLTAELRSLLKVLVEQGLLHKSLPVWAHILCCSPLAVLIWPKHNVQAQNFEFVGLVSVQVGHWQDRVPLLEPLELHTVTIMQRGWDHAVCLLLVCTGTDNIVQRAGYPRMRGYCSSTLGLQSRVATVLMFTCDWGCRLCKGSQSGL